MEQLQVKNDPAKLQQLLGSKLYSDKYSFIQEALQNSTDAMRKCGKADQPFDVNIYREDDKYYFSIRDYGCSFDSIAEFKRLIGTLLESSKTQDKDNSENQELGKFGIGSIAVAAYNPKWNYKVYKNGKGFDAELKEIEGQGLFMSNPEYYDTNEVDGVFLQVEIIDNPINFVNKLFEKAKYFQNIKFNFDANAINQLRFDYQRDRLVKINEDFQIFKSEDFQYSTLNRNRQIHICIDQYSYDINWNEVGLNPIFLPIALRFNLNDFEVNPTREVITIREDYKDKIRDKMIKVADWFVNKWNEQHPAIECSNLKHYEGELGARESKIYNLAGNAFNIGDFCFTFSELEFNKPTFKGITPSTLHDFKKFMNRVGNKFFQGVARVRYGTLSRNVFLSFDDYNYSYLVTKSFSKTYQKYFKEVLKEEESKIFRKTDVKFTYSDPNPHDVNFINYMSGYERLKTFSELSEEQIFAIEKQYEDFTILLEEFEKCIPHVENIVPKDYVASIPKKATKKEKIEKGEGEVILKYPREPQKWIQWDAVWEDTACKIKELRKFKYLHIYGTESKRKDLEAIFTFTKRTNLKTIMVTDKMEAIIKEEDPQNFIHIDTLRTKFEVMSKYITASFIKENMKGYQYLFDNVDTIEKYISTKIANDVKSLRELMANYNVEYNVADNIVKEMHDFYKENPKMYNQEFMFIFNNVNKIKDNLDFLQLFNSDMRDINHSADYRRKRAELALKTLRDICRARKVRMNWENYNLDKIEDYFKPVIVEPQEEVCV